MVRHCTLCSLIDILEYQEYLLDNESEGYELFSQSREGGVGEGEEKDTTVHLVSVSSACLNLHSKPIERREFFKEETFEHTTARLRRFEPFSYAKTRL